MCHASPAYCDEVSKLKNGPKLLAAVTVCVATFTTMPSHATTVWSYSYAASGVSGSGYLATSSTATPGEYAIQGVSGKIGTTPVESLLAAGTYLASGGGVLTSDNLLFAASPSLGLGGFTVRAGPDLYNVYNAGGQYYQLAGADCNGLTCGTAGHLGTSVSFSAMTVPSIDWNFAYFGVGISATGVLTTLATAVGGEYQIVGLSGTHNGQAMNALFPAGTYLATGGGVLTSDNLLSATAPYLQTGGFTFHAGDDRYNVYDLNGQHYDLTGADCGASNCGQPGHLGTPISFTVSTVPEPDSAVLLGLGLIGLGFVRRWKKIVRSTTFLKR